MCRLRNIATCTCKCDYQDSVTTRQTHTHGRTDRRRRHKNVFYEKHMHQAKTTFYPIPGQLWSQDSEVMFVAWNKCLLWRGLIGLLSFIADNNTISWQGHTILNVRFTPQTQNFWNLCCDQCNLVIASLRYPNFSEYIAIFIPQPERSAGASTSTLSICLPVIPSHLLK